METPCQPVAPLAQHILFDVRPYSVHGTVVHSVVCLHVFCLPDWVKVVERTVSSPCGAEIEPGHVNASKYLHVTEQHMTQLGIPVFNSVPPSATSLKWTPEPFSEADLPMSTQPAKPQPPQATGKPGLTHMVE